MALPKFGPKEFRNAALGLGALALSAIPLVSGPSFAEDGQNARTTAASSVSASMMVPTEEDLNTVPLQGATRRSLSGETGSAQFTQAADTVNRPSQLFNAAEFEQFDVPFPQAPTTSRPYHYIKFDASTLKSYEGSPSEAFALTASPHYMTVFNFIDESSAYSRMQNEVLDKTLAAIAPRSESKEIVRIDVIVRDAAGKTIYGSDFRAFYADNRLGPDKSNVEQLMLPYGMVFGEELAAGHGSQLYDFSLVNGARTNADLVANADAISGTLVGIVTAYNRKNLAALENEGQATLVASYD